MYSIQTSCCLLMKIKLNEKEINKKEKEKEILDFFYLFNDQKLLDKISIELL